MEKTSNGEWQDQIFLRGPRPYLWIIFTGILLHWQVIFFSFTQFDDKILILDRVPFFKNISNFFLIFRQSVFATLPRPDSYYRPLLTLSFMANSLWGGASPYVYYITNIAIHLAACCLLFLLLARLKYPKSSCLFFSLIFCVHPVLSQSVAWIPGRNDSLLAVFCFAAFILFLDYADSKRWKPFAGHLACFFLALLTKESGIILILACLLYSVLFLRNKMFSSRQKALFAGWFFAVAGWFLLRVFTLTSPVGLTVVQRIKLIANNFPAIPQYLGKILLPFDLSVMPTIRDTSLVYGVVAIVLLITLLFWSENRRGSRVAFGFGWFLMFLLPSVVSVSSVPAYFLEHRVYIPMVGIMIVLLETDWIKRIDFNKIKAQVAAVLLIGTLFTATFCYAKNFKNPLNFWRGAVKGSPRLAAAYAGLGNVYYFAGFLEEAKKEYLKCLELNPQEWNIHSNLGLIYAQGGLYLQAKEEFMKELFFHPQHSDAWHNLGTVYYTQGDFNQAEAMWKKAIEFNKNSFKSYKNLSILYYEKEDFEKSKYYLMQLAQRGIEAGELTPGQGIKLHE